jgi:hypothetical protein
MMFGGYLDCSKGFFFLHFRFWPRIFSRLFVPFLELPETKDGHGMDGIERADEMEVDSCGLTHFGFLQGGRR